MKLLVFIPLLIMLALQSVLILTQEQPPQVMIPGMSTTLTGVWIPYRESQYVNTSLTLQAYLGIPFAEPPVGDRRFRYPVKKGNLGSTYQATSDRAICPQISPLDEFMPPSVGKQFDEDCLYLSVFAPAPLPSEAPVMVWIHGGGYSVQSGSWLGYEPTPLIALSPDIVVVNINYRLGVYGFLTTGDSVAPGNYGMLDQVMALEWVQENIGAFGGDPGTVTIMGESAGAASVGLHLLSPLSRDLFHQAIMESGNALSPWAVDTDMQRQLGITAELADMLKCSASTNEVVIECLRGVEEHDLTRAQLTLSAKYLYNEFLYTPVVDNHFLPDTPAKLISQQDFCSVPTLAGTNKDEGTLIALKAHPSYVLSKTPPTMTLAEFREVMPLYLYNDSPLLRSAVDQWYVNWTQADNSSADQLRAFIDLNTDQMFACPTEATTRALVGSGAPVYRYEMAHHPSWSLISGIPGWLGAGHGEELPFVFGWEFSRSRIMRIYVNQTEEEIWMSMQVMRYWTNFIKTGNPNDPVSSEEYPDWPRYTLPEQEYKILSLTMENGRAMRMDSCAFWLNYVPALYNYENSDNIYQEWKRNYEEWRDVHMVEWSRQFQQYKDNSGC